MRRMMKDDENHIGGHHLVRRTTSCADVLHRAWGGVSHHHQFHQFHLHQSVWKQLVAVSSQEVIEYK